RRSRGSPGDPPEQRLSLSGRGTGKAIQRFRTLTPHRFGRSLAPPSQWHSLGETPQVCKVWRPGRSMGGSDRSSPRFGRKCAVPTTRWPIMLSEVDLADSSLAEDWFVLKDAVKRFEHDWRRDSRPALDDYLPAEEPLRTRVLIELVHIDLELRLKAGKSARVEGSLPPSPGWADDRTASLNLIAAEHALRRRREPGLPLSEYLKRFPQYRAALPEWIAQSTVHCRHASPCPPELR